MSRRRAEVGTRIGLRPIVCRIHIVPRLTKQATIDKEGWPENQVLSALCLALVRAANMRRVPRQRLPQQEPMAPAADGQHRAGRLASHSSRETRPQRTVYCHRGVLPLHDSNDDQHPDVRNGALVGPGGDFPRSLGRFSPIRSVGT